MSKYLLCYLASSSVNMPPTILVGKIKEEDNESVVLSAPLSADIAYFSLVGKRLKPLVDSPSINKAREDKSLRAIPQMAPSDFCMTSCKSVQDYADSKMSINRRFMQYAIPLDPDGLMARAYELTLSKLAEGQQLHKYFHETIFELDSISYLDKMTEPDKIDEVFVPRMVGADQPAR